MIEERGRGLFLNSKYWSYLAQVGIVAVIYFSIAKLSLALTGHPSPVWPPAGFALAVILLFGYRLWPGIAMGMFMEVILEGLPVPIAFATAAGSTAGALAGAYLFNRLGFRNSMERPRDVLGLVVLGSAVSPTIGATSGALSFYLSGIIPWAASGSFWMTWWLGNMLGVIVVTPVFLAWSLRPRFDLKPMQIPEALALLALLVLVSDFIFSRPVAYIGYEYMLFPFLIWAALRFGQKGATTAIIILSGIAIWHTSHGYGPFVVGTPAENLIILQIFTSIVALTIMTLAAIVTERNLIEDSLRKEKMFIDDALNGLQDVFFVLDVNGRLLKWNNALSSITGYSDEEISTKKPGDFFLGEDIRNISNAIEMVVKNGTAKVEAEIVTKNGEHINYEFTGTVLRNSRGKPLGICGAGRNITELKRAALEYKTILHTAMDGFYCVDTQGRILDVNDSYCSLIGYSREELLNMSLKDIDVLDTEEDIAQRIKRVMENGWDRFETHHKCKDGRIVEIEASVNYDKAGGGKLFAFMRDITKSNQVQKAYKESEARLSEAQRVAHIGNWEWKLKTNELHWSTENYKIFGLSPTISPTFQDFLNNVHPDDFEFVKKSIDESFHGKNYDLDIRIIKPDGSDGYVHATGIVIFDEEGNPTRMFGTVQDITERKLIEYELSKFKMGIERSNEAIFITNIDGTIIYINPAFESLYGFNRKEVLGKTPRILKSGLLPSEAYKLFWDTLLSKNIVSGDLINKTKDGRLLNIVGSANPIINDKRNIIGFLAIQRDVTEHKRIIEMLTESEERFHSITQSANDAIITMDGKGDIIFWNKGAHKIFGYDNEEVIGKPMTFLMPEIYRDAHRNGLKRLVATGVSQFIGKTVELSGTRKDSTVFPLDLSLSTWKAGEVIYYTGILRDITERRQIEDKIKRHEVHLKDMLDLHRLSNSTENEVLDFTLEASLRSLQSEFAFVGIMSADEAVMTVRKSSNGAMKQGTVIDEPLVFPIAKSGLLGEAVRQRGPIIVNDYKSSQLFKKGYPEGHAPIKRFLSLPIFSGNRIVAIAAAANKVSEYTESDVTYFTSFLNEMWGILDYQGTREEIRKSLEEKEVLLREIHHRVKNNMQIVSSLLRLQSQNIDDIKYKDILIESQTRIYSMALIHEKLYQSKRIAQINLKEYIDGLVSNIIESFGQKSNIKFDIDVEKILIQIDYAVPCGLLINELVTNSFKYAFPDGRLGIIKISAKLNNNGFIQLSISDDGIGIPKDMDIRNTKSLGLKLITGLTESQLHGEVILNRDSGTEFQINFRQAK